MKRNTRLLSTVVILIAAASVLVNTTGCTRKSVKADSDEKCAAVSVHSVILKDTMRQLWEDHIVWTRNVILCLVDELPGTDQAAERLLQNQVDIGNVLKAYYGDEAGTQLTRLLNDHINISTDFIMASKAGNDTALAVASKKWRANADEIALFLSKTIPGLTADDMKMMMSNHLNVTIDEINQRLKKDYNADVIAYDKVHAEMLKMSDMIANGIEQQFPERFEVVPAAVASR